MRLSPPLRNRHPLLSLALASWLFLPKSAIDQLHSRDGRVGKWPHPTRDQRRVPHVSLLRHGFYTATKAIAHRPLLAENVVPIPISSDPRRSPRPVLGSKQKCHRLL